MSRVVRSLLPVAHTYQSQHRHDAPTPAPLTTSTNSAWLRFGACATLPQKLGISSGVSGLEPSRFVMFREPRRARPTAAGSHPQPAGRLEPHDRPGPSNGSTNATTVIPTARQTPHAGLTAHDVNHAAIITTSTTHHLSTNTPLLYHQRHLTAVVRRTHNPAYRFHRIEPAAIRIRWGAEL